MKNLNNKVVVITGAGSGIGRSLAIKMHESGALLALNDFNDKTLEETVHIIDDVNKIYSDVESDIVPPGRSLPEPIRNVDMNQPDSFEVHQEVEESLSLEDREKELIKKALEKHRGKRKYAASELGISERTLYRKIKEYNLTDK